MLKRKERNFVDTNVLLDNLDFLESFLETSKLTVLKSVLVELDYLKDSKKVSFRARRAVKFIRENLDRIEILDDKTEFGQEIDADNFLVKFAKKHKGSQVLTHDNNLKLILQSLDISFIEPPVEKRDKYKGIIYIGEEVDIYSEPAVVEKHGAVSGSYIVHGTLAFLYQEGQLQRVFGGVKEPILNNTYCGKIKPKNLEQACAINALLDESATIVSLTGDYGSGKSYLAFNYALQELSKGRYKKIVFIPNNAQARDTKDYGALPGTLYDKAEPFFASLSDILGSKMFVEQLYKEEKLEILPIAFARGRSLENCFVFVNEAQNLTDYHVKLLIGRISENTKIVFDGDIKQTDSFIFKERSGLALIDNLSGSEYTDLYRSIRLQKTERSRTAEVAGFLDKL